MVYRLKLCGMSFAVSLLAGSAPTRPGSCHACRDVPGKNASSSIMVAEVIPRFFVAFLLMCCIIRDWCAWGADEICPAESLEYSIRDLSVQ